MTTLKLKVVLVGDGGVGKTAFIKRHITGEFERKYVATMGVEVHPLTFNTWSSSNNKGGCVQLNIWDCAGQEQYSGLADGYYIGGDAAIVMFDVSSLTSYKNARLWINKLRNTMGNVPIILCGNKIDSMDRIVLPQHITLHKEMNCPYYDISAKANANLRDRTKPFLEIIQNCLGDDTLILTE